MLFFFLHIASPNTCALKRDSTKNLVMFVKQHCNMWHQSLYDQTELLNERIFNKPVYRLDVEARCIYSLKNTAASSAGSQEGCVLYTS